MPEEDDDDDILSKINHFLMNVSAYPGESCME